MPTRSVLWLRRDLRLHDHPALVEAATTTDEVVPLFVIDASLWTTSGGARREYLRHSLTALNASMENNLVVRVGNPADVVPRVAREVGASAVHISADFAPYGSIRDAAVEKALDATGVLLQRTGSPYAVSPGRVRKADRTPYRVYTPYYRAWCEHGWRAPAELVPVSWVSGVASDTLTHSPTEALPLLPEAGERAALARWAEFRDDALEDYADRRDRPDLRATSHLSVHLKFGEIHPRTLLADLGSPHAKLPKSHEIFRKELAWREFYADVLHHEPQSAREYLRPEFAHMEYDAGPSAERKLALWQGGNTGFPIVDAGMRQLLAEGWMHNRVRMIVASFLVKDLHLEWQEGARWFMRHLVDGDLASNSHGWQWTAGCGTDAAPYFRVFNPITQGLRYDPDGEYVRRYVPELAHLHGPEVHEPWKASDGYLKGYPERIVDHAAERIEALTRYQLIKS